VPPLRSATIPAALSVILFAALFARLGGAGATVLPSALSLAALALAAMLLRVGVINYRSLAEAISNDWRGLVAKYGFAIGLGALALVGVAIRLPSIGADLGHQPIDIDEHRLAANVRLFFVKGEIGHRTVEHYPGILFWALSGGSLLNYLHGLMNGSFATIRSMPVESFVFAGRLVNTLAGALTVVVAGLMGRQISGSGAGLLAAGLMAIAPLSVNTTTAMRNDPAQVLLICAAIHAALVASTTDRRLWPVLAGVFGGAATAIKYTSVFTLVPAVLASLMRGSPPARFSRAGLVVLAFALTVATTNHFLWWDFPNFLEQLSDQIAITGPGHWAATKNPGAFQTETLVYFGVGWALLIVAAGYGVYGLATGQRQAWVFWLFPLLYCWFVTKRPSQFQRWVFPLLPFVAVAGAVAMVWILARVRGWRGWAARPGAAVQRAAATAILILAVLAQPLWSALMTFSQRVVPKTHHVVEQWLRQRPAGDRVLVGPGWLDLDGSSLKVRRVRDLGAALQGSDYALAASDWVIVPEVYFKHPGLQRLTLVKRVSADYKRLGGIQGYDFEIYAPPKLPPTTGAIDIRFDDVAADPFLGSEWATRTKQPGRLLPATGASLFLPARATETATITVDVANDATARATPGFSIADGVGPVSLVDAVPSEPSRRSFRGVARLALEGRATELRLTPDNRATRVHVVRVVVD
jgi:hypothetical protein